MSDDPSQFPRTKFDTLFREHAPVVYRMAYRALHGDAGLAEDVVQEVFVAVWRQFDRDFLYLDNSRAGAVIATIAHRRVADIWRRRGPELTPLESCDADSHPADPDSETSRAALDRLGVQPEVSRLWTLVRRALTEQEYRVAVLAWDFELPDRTIARMLGIKTSTVYSVKSRARQKIRAIERDREFDRAHDPAQRGGGVTA